MSRRPVPHVALVALDQRGARGSPGGQARAVVEHAPVAAVLRVPRGVPPALRVRDPRVVRGRVAGAVDHSILTVSSVRIEGDVGDDTQLGKALLQCRDHDKFVLLAQT